MSGCANYSPVKFLGERGVKGGEHVSQIIVFRKTLPYVWSSFAQRDFCLISIQKATNVSLADRASADYKYPLHVLSPVFRTSVRVCSPR